MDPERWRKIEELYNAASACDSKDRSAILDRCDPEIRREVESLLAQKGSFLDRPAWQELPDSDTTISASARTSLFKEGDQLGAYQIAALLGEGGALRRGAALRAGRGDLG